jgi:hypothetical protein
MRKRIALIAILAVLLTANVLFAGAVQIDSWGAKRGANDDITSMTGLDDNGIPLAKVANAASDGANSDITSISGLTTPLTVAQGGQGAATLTDGGIILGSGTGAVTPMGVLAAGEIVVGDGATDPIALAAGATTDILVGGGAASPVWTAATGTGAPVRENGPTLIAPALGTPASGTLTSCTGLPTAGLATQVFATGIGIGGAASGTGGVAFPAAAVAVADVNTLDDYEEKNFETTVTCITSGSYVLNGSFDTLICRKIGSLVHIQGTLQIDSESAPSGQLQIALPFAVLNSGPVTTFSPFALRDHGDGGIEQPNLVFAAGSAFAALVNFTDAGALEVIDESRVDTAFKIYVNHSYITD